MICSLNHADVERAEAVLLELPGQLLQRRQQNLRRPVAAGMCCSNWEAKGTSATLITDRPPQNRPVAVFVFHQCNVSVRQTPSACILSGPRPASQCSVGAA